MGGLLFKNKHRVPSARLTGWDYSAGGFYFVTVCVKQHECVFGGINNGVMCLNRLGAVVYSEWLKTFELRPHILCDSFIIMPNHMHAIVKINNDSINDNGRDVPRHVFTCADSKTNQFGPLPSNSLQSIINHFKGAVTKYANQNNIDFQWLPRFHDRIIRNEQSLYNIRKYTINNPANWRLDKFFN